MTIPRDDDPEAEAGRSNSGEDSLRTSLLDPGSERSRGSTSTASRATRGDSIRNAIGFISSRLTFTSTPVVATPVGEPSNLSHRGTFNVSQNGNTTFERTTNPDGSLSVKVTTTEPRPDGHRTRTLEHYHVPPVAAVSVSIGLDAGETPGGIYLKKREQFTLPPEMRATHSSPGVAYVVPGSVSGTSSVPAGRAPASSAGTGGGDNESKPGLLIIVPCFVAFAAIVGIIFLVVKQQHRYSNCVDTPGYKNYLGYGCGWYYGGDPDCDSYGGIMGTGSQNCCVCGGGSTHGHTPNPTPSPTPIPTKDPDCVDTPGYKNYLGYGCEWFFHGDPSCDYYGGDMGTGSQNCCVCGGGSNRSCIDTPGYENNLGYGCDWYHEGDWYCDRFGGIMGTGSQNCCVCGGGSAKRTPSPTTTLPSQTTLAPSFSTGPTNAGELGSAKPTPTPPTTFAPGPQNQAN